ncbi:hypothetical protein LDENG_00063850 [Lucifuga dentata]|nr:hypothetical protein LDENG_00063850 [Lucifuga dentata]
MSEEQTSGSRHATARLPSLRPERSDERGTAAGRARGCPGHVAGLWGRRFREGALDEGSKVHLWLFKLITSDIEKSALYLIPTSKDCVISLALPPLSCTRNALRAAVQFSERIKVIMHRKTGNAL